MVDEKPNVIAGKLADLLSDDLPMNKTRDMLGLPRWGHAGGRAAVADPEEDTAQEPIDEPDIEVKAEPKEEPKEDNDRWVINEQIARTHQGLDTLARQQQQIQAQLQRLQQPSEQEFVDDPLRPLQSELQSAKQEMWQLKQQTAYDRAQSIYARLSDKHPDFEKLIPRARFDAAVSHQLRTNNVGTNWEPELQTAYDAARSKVLAKENEELKARLTKPRAEKTETPATRSTAKVTTGIPRAGASRSTPTVSSADDIRRSDTGKPIGFRRLGERFKAILNLKGE